jgi:hypothetical protein
MRLSEFANPKDYTPTATDADDFLQQLLRIWPDRLADDPASSNLHSRKQPRSMPRQRADALSIGSDVAGV